MKNSLIDKYLCDKDSICREERQYAVFLYNYLNSLKENSEDILQYKNKLFGDDDITIKYVFYEATFMRDFFYWDRKGRESKNNVEEQYLSKERFNKYLLDYVKCIVNDNTLRREIEPGRESQEDKEEGSEKSKKKKWFCSESEVKELNNFIQNIPDYYYEYHLGMAIGREVGKKSDKHNLDLGENINILLKALMNSKPDIAVIFEKNGVSKLAFFECKFESPEGSSGKKEAKISQTEAQNAIAYFLTKYFSKKENEKDKIYQIADDWKKTKIVNFYRDEAKSREDEVDICITELIDKYKNTIKVDLKSKYCKKKTKVENGGKNNDK